jgi:4-aminobutyrate aminotransferase-like enzyme
MALANIAEIASKNLVKKSAVMGQLLLDELASCKSTTSTIIRARGKGLMAGLVLSMPNGKPATSASLNVIKKLLGRGFVLLPEGPAGNVIGFTPSLIISREQIRSAVQALETELEAV